MKRSASFVPAAVIAACSLVVAAATPASAVTPPQSTAFATAAEESYSTYQLPGNGDLWPSCWADDDNVYAANGDGTAFGSTYSDMAVSRISGMPPNLTGTTLATNVGTNWSGSNYNRKPTGMVCVGNAIYLAFQNLNTNFNDAPVASIAKSSDHGATWSWDTGQPMFTNHVFTTIFFLDYGKNYAHAIDGYVYAYGFDNNWREQQKLYLARVPATSIQTRATWQFYTGTDGNGNPTWSSDISAKVPVLEDDRRLYPVTFNNSYANFPVLGQGGVVYDAPLNRYIFTSWSFATHELYEAPNPWGPWSLFLSRDFGPLQLVHNRGQYGTSIPSKYVSADGKTLYLQSNLCAPCINDSTGNSYTFSLRKLWLQPYAATTPSNTPDDTNNLAVTGAGTTAISKSTHFGTLCSTNCSDILNNGITTENEDDFDQEVKSTDWWGYTWNRAYNINKIVYTTGTMFPDGGWYSGGLTVQVRQNFNWVNVTGLHVTPDYPYSSAAGTNTTYTFTFDNTWGDGVRIIGTPGGTSHFTSIAELAVYYGGGNLVGDPGFENQTTTTVSPPWATEGPDPKGIDLGAGFAHSGNNNAWIRDATTNWNAITQRIAVQPNTSYLLTGWIRNNFTSNLGYFGVRQADGVTVLKETSFGALPNYTQLSVAFNSGPNATVTVYGGFWGQGSDYWIQMDDVSLVQQ